MTKTIEKKKSKLFKKLAKKNGWKVKEIKLKKGDPADLRGFPTWDAAVEADLQERLRTMPTPRTAEQVFETFMDELRPVNVDELRQSYEHITNRLHPTLANRKPWPAWPEVKATDELHREFLSRHDSDKVQEIKERLYKRLHDLQMANASRKEHRLYHDGHIKFVADLLDIIERS